MNKCTVADLRKMKFDKHIEHKEPMNKNHLIINLVVIVTGFSVAIAAIYVWLIPTFLNGYKTYLFFIAGVCGAALCAGQSCIKARKNQTEQEKTTR